ncbi:MAG: hypothetical protein ACUVTE_05375 [Candidatus Bathycorpusculaceae bacterium]
MKKQNENKHQKSLKLITLLITSLIIATVSAQVYSYMYINGSITIRAQKLIWIKGGDAPSDTTISGGTVTMDLDVEAGTIQNFTECLFLKNQDSAAHNLTITVTTAASSSTFEVVKIYIYKNSTGSWEYVDTLDVTVLNDQYSTYTGKTPLISGGYYRLTFEVKANTGTSGTHDFKIEVRYE